MPRPEVSLVIPIYNEEEVLPSLDERLRALLAKIEVDCEVVFVNDGSRDRSLELLRSMAEHEPRYRAISFSRNFGHQRAITAGMDMTRGKAVVVMDADLQDPPEVIIEMIARWREGFDVVYGRRRSREGETFFKLLTAKIFYRLFSAMIPIEVPLDTGDFRLMSRRVVLTMRELRETHRFVRGLVAWVGFKQTAVEYDRAARVAGETKYPLKKMLAFAVDGIASFSVLPLRLATYLGVLVGLASVLYAVAAVITHWIGMTVPGWTTTVVLVSFLFSVQLLMTGVLGEYIGKIYEQVKGRPLYVVAERINFKKRRPVRRRAATQDFGELAAHLPVGAFGPGVAGAVAPPPSVRGRMMTDRPPMGAAMPPPAQGPLPPPPATPSISSGSPSSRPTALPSMPLSSSPSSPPPSRASSRPTALPSVPMTPSSPPPPPSATPSSPPPRASVSPSSPPMTSRSGIASPPPPAASRVSEAPPTKIMPSHASEGAAPASTPPASTRSEKPTATSASTPPAAPDAPPVSARSEESPAASTPPASPDASPSTPPASPDATPSESPPPSKKDSE